MATETLSETRNRHDPDLLLKNWSDLQASDANEIIGHTKEIEYIVIHCRLIKSSYSQIERGLGAVRAKTTSLKPDRSQ